MVKKFDEHTKAALLEVKSRMDRDALIAQARLEGAQILAVALLGIDSGRVLPDLSGVDVPDEPKEPPSGTQG